MNWIKQTLTSSATGNPSTKRLVVFVAAMALVSTLLALGFACAYWIWTHGDLGGGAFSALLSISSTTAALAGVAYRKQEGETK